MTSLGFRNATSQCGWKVFYPYLLVALFGPPAMRFVHLHLPQVLHLFFSISRTACHEVSEPHAWNLFVENWLKLKLHNFNSIQMFYIEMQSFQDHFKHAPRTHVTTLPMFNLMLIMLIYWKVRPGSPTSAGQIMKVANLDSKSVSQWDSFWATIHYL